MSYEHSGKKRPLCSGSHQDRLRTIQGKCYSFVLEMDSLQYSVRRRRADDALVVIVLDEDEMFFLQILAHNVVIADNFG